MDVNPESEYRIYLSSRGDEPVAREVMGHELMHILGLVRNANPNDTIYVREITERVALVIKPEEALSNGFHFTS